MRSDGPNYRARQCLCTQSYIIYFTCLLWWGLTIFPCVWCAQRSENRGAWWNLNLQSIIRLFHNVMTTGNWRADTFVWYSCFIAYGRLSNGYAMAIYNCDVCSFLGLENPWQFHDNRGELDEVRSAQILFWTMFMYQSHVISPFMPIMVRFTNFAIRVMCSKGWK